MFHICVKVAGVGVSRVIDWLIFIFLDLNFFFVCVVLLWSKQCDAMKNDNYHAVISSRWRRRRPSHVTCLMSSTEREKCIFFISFVQLKVILLYSVWPFPISLFHKTLYKLMRDVCLRYFTDTLLDEYYRSKDLWTYFFLQEIISHLFNR